MAILRVKRGTSIPTTSNLSYLGELAFNYSTNELYVRGTSNVVKIGGEMEMVHYYEGSASLINVTYNFDRNYIYKVHVIAATNGGTSDTSQTVINYRTSGGSNFLGSYVNIMNSDVTQNFTNSSKYNSSFTINDAFSSSVTPSYAVTKVIDFELSPTFESSYTSTYQWVAYGCSICTVSDQSNAPMTYTQFAHSIDGQLGGIYINPGLDLGSNDSIAISIYRIKRK